MANAEHLAPAFVPKRKKLLTRPILKMEQDVTRFVKIVAAMYIGKEMKKKKGDDDKQKEPATLIDCIDLETGEPAQIVANTVLKSVLADEYPDAGYVNKCFAITKQSKQAGRDYFKFKIEEIEDPAESKEKTAKQDAAIPETPTPIHGKKRA